MQLKGDRIAAYARYSSDRQSESSVDDQLRRIRSFASARGKRVDERLIFTDHAISGASTERPGFEALMERIKRREIDVLLVEDTSRLSRDNADALNLYKLLSFYGVQLVAISDGIDSSSKGAKLAYSVKALMSDMYLEDLRDKTLRGMEGRALAGKAVGGRALGYRSVPVIGPDGRTPAHYEIEIEPEGAAIVRRIFDMYLNGRSFLGIATALNKEGIPSPRERTRHERKSGWTDGTVRAILYNERYTGFLIFNERRWIKVPGTNKRIPQKKDPSEVIRVHREDLRIVDQAVWDAVQARLGEVRDRYTVSEDGTPKGRAHGAVSHHPLSGLLICGACKLPMIIGGASGPHRYYVCPNNRRGRCDVRTKVRAKVAEQCILGAMRERLLNGGADHIRKQLARRMDEIARNHHAEVKDRRTRLERAQKRIATLVEVIASGERSPAVSEALKEAEAQAALERAAIAEIDRLANQPIRILTPAEVTQRIDQIEALVKADPLAAREQLKRCFRAGKIGLHETPEGVFVARTELLGEIFLVETRTPAGGANLGRALYLQSSGGATCRFTTTVRFAGLVPKLRRRR